MKGLNRRVFFVVWLLTLAYLLYLALWKASTTVSSRQVEPASVAPFDTGKAQVAPASSAVSSGFSSVGDFSSSMGTLPGQAPAVPVVQGMAANTRRDFSPGAQAPAAHPVPPAKLVPTKCVDRTAGLPVTEVHRHAPGQVCLKNMYVYEGILYVQLPPKDSPGYAPVREYLDKEGLPSESFKELTTEVKDGLLRAPLPSAPYVVFQLETPQPGAALGDRDHILAQFYGFLEGAINILIMQSLESKTAEDSGKEPPSFFPAPVLCCGCGPHLGGLAGLNIEVSRGLWGGELDFCKSVTGNPPGPRPPALLAPCSPTSALFAGQHKAQGWPKPWAMHVEMGCISDRQAAFNLDGRVEKWKNYFASLLPLIGDKERGHIEQALGRARDYATSVASLKGQWDGFKDELGTAIAPMLIEEGAAEGDKTADGGGDRGPLITVLQRPEGNARLFPPIAVQTLANFFKKYTKRFLFVRTSALPALLQMAIVAKTDLLVGTHGGDLGLLMFQPPGAAVLQIATHYTHFNVDGTGWSNAIPFLSRVKGVHFGAIDALRGPVNPVGLEDADMGYQMDMDVYVNVTGLGWEVDRIFKAQEAAKKGKEVKFWHPMFTTELESYPGSAVKANY